MANEKQSATEETVEYEYVEVPDDGIEYEYVEAPEGEEVEYEYVEVPEEEAAAETAETTEAAEPELPAEEEVEYEYVEVPEEDAATGTAEAPEPELPAEEEVEYEYVEVPEEDAVAETAEAPEPELPAEEEVPPLEDAAPETAEALNANEESEPPLPPEEDEAPDSLSGLPDAEMSLADELELPADDENGTESIENDLPAASAADLEDLEGLEDTENDVENEEAPVEEPADPAELSAKEEAEYENAEISEEETAAETAEAPAPELSDDEEGESVSETADGNEEEPESDSLSVEQSGSMVTADDAESEIDVYAEKAAEQLAEEVSGESIDAEIAEEAQEELDPDELSDTLPAPARFVFDGREDAAFTGTPEKETVLLDLQSGRFSPLSAWHLVVAEADGTDVVSLIGKEGSDIDFENEAKGVLVGPDDVKLTFSGLKKLVIPALPEPQPPVYISPEDDLAAPDTFVFTRPQIAEGKSLQTDKPHIAIKTGYSLYGWNVLFENGTSMSLSDVRSYQSKHHSLPDKNGVISYGKASLSFTGAQRITAYEKPSYCAYGLPPAV